VVYDTINAAIARGYDTVIVDTAGRMHTKVNLMEEMKKIRRAAGKLVPGSPHETLLVLDATTGQNAFSQLRLFHEAVGLTGLVLTKIDGTARGGVVLGLAREFPVPVKLVGIGEKIEDLQDFDAEAFVDALYDR
jgi:fused signal recognition particle receptor